MGQPAVRSWGRVELALLWTAILVLLAVRIAFDLGSGLLADEAYYWLWGQHLDWSYFDHPPLHAWLLHIVSLVFGWSAISVRLLTWLSLAGVLAVFQLWAARLAPDDRERTWLWMAAAYLASPLFLAMTTVAFNDHLLVLLSLLALHCFALFVERTEAGAPGRWRVLYAGAVCLGLATLSKYNGAFVGVGFALVLLLRPGLRGVLRGPHPWLAGLIAVAMQAPVLYWNASNGLASFRFHLDERWGPTAGQVHPTHPVLFLLLNVVTLSPFLAWAMIRALRARPAPGFGSSLKTLTLTTFTVSTVTLTIVSVFLDAYFYWNIVALAGLVPLAALEMRRGWVRFAHLTYGLVFAGLLVFNFTVYPITSSVGVRNSFTGENYGWAEVAAHMRAAQAQHPTDIVAASGWGPTSQLALALGTPDIVSLSDERSQYTYWQAGLALEGKSALVLADAVDTSKLKWLKAHFGRLTELDSFTITRLDRTIYKWRILLAEDFTAAP